ncbi:MULTISPECIES: DUF7123 family protein [Halorussus]|uniref:DUF7123 family protein n=1 Tax=Halorussus TaxID=1070314 RepID=UPI00209D2008|nr:hypothetical protein [Halorussus vallis]USZ75152.1 hypothetical protein NGM07_17175 [Halorussus vallis]
MSTTAAGTTATTLTDKQQRILQFLREKGQMKTYFKSRLIGDELDMTAKEVGANMTAIADGEFDVDVEKWGYSSSTTWKVTV